MRTVWDRFGNEEQDKASHINEDMCRDARSKKRAKKGT